jgi:hypothetical protein
MVEEGDSLRTWALADAPTPDRDIAAEPLAAHRLEYLEYEGPISDNRGQVTRWDHGECAIEEATNESFRATVRGEKLNGTIEIKLNDQGASHFRWHVPNSES